MRDRVILLAGDGKVRCATPVLASLATWYPDDIISISLFDANLERLDLISRLAQKLFDDFNRDLMIRSSTDLAEASEGTTDLVLMLNEDGSRRMVGAVGSDTLQAFEEMEEDPFELRKGDRNRPTPPDQLSPATDSWNEVANKHREEVCMEVYAAMVDCIDQGIGRIIAELLTAEDEELTPTMKLKRQFVHRKYAALIEGMYRGGAAG